MSTSQVHYEDVIEGMELPGISYGPVTTEMMVRFMAARNNYHPIHYDKDFARAEGHPDVLVEGPMKFALFERLIRDWMGEEGTLRKISATYRGIDIPGNTLLIKGKVISKGIEGDQGSIHCELWAENQTGAMTTKGNAVVMLPFKSKDAT
ncbi:MAG: acyl dehydratase [Deltaproteobacteria bacterium]|nr:acyl dehydratase [Deltaproteobacteria bacterium]